MKHISLNHGLVAFVDDQDFSALIVHKWYATRAARKRETYYALRRNPETGGTIYMHRAILLPPEDLTIDHIDGDGLNNVRANLRVATPAENNANRAFENKTGYRGVAKVRNTKWFQACIGMGPGSRPHSKRIGYFLSAEDAARAYDAAALERYGVFARLNFPNTKVNQ